MERFIELVKARSFIYDSDHAHFKNRDKRVQAWNEIAQKMGTDTGNYWRFKWNCLKENYSKFKKINANPSNQTYRKYRNWPWAENMRFLDNFPSRSMLKRRRLNSHIKNDLSDIPDNKPTLANDLEDKLQTEVTNPNDLPRVKSRLSDELSDYLETPKNDIEAEHNEVFFIEKSFTVEEDSENPVENIQLIIQNDGDEDQCKDDKKTKTQKTSDFGDYLRAKKNKKNDFDEVEHFFMSYAKTFKRLPVKLQRVLKLEMVTLFARYELQAENMDMGNQTI